jgi:hypothetical protein
MLSVTKTKRYSVYGVAAVENASKLNHHRAEESFSRKLVAGDEEHTLDFVVIKLDQSAFAWCGLRSGAPRLDSLALGMMLNKSKPVATGILGGSSFAVTEDEASALRVAKKAGLVAVHFGSSLGPDADQALRMFAEKNIIEALKA